MEFDEPIFNDALFYQKRKHGKYRVEPAPSIDAPIADTHAHVQMLPDPALALAKCMLWGDDFVCVVCDVCEDAERAFGNLAAYQVAAPARARELAEATLALPVDDNPAGAEAQAHIRARMAMPGWDDGVRMRIIVGCHPHNAKEFDAVAQESI